MEDTKLNILTQVLSRLVEELVLLVRLCTVKYIRTNHELEKNKQNSNMRIADSFISEYMQ